MPFSERRKYPRVFESVPCQVQVGPSALVTQAKNLSCGGVLCILSVSLPLMTRLEVILQLPGAGRGSPPGSVRCVGVVVRQEPQPPSSAGEAPSFQTAIYFSDIKPEDRRRIAEFVLQSMLSHDRRRS